LIALKMLSRDISAGSKVTNPVLVARLTEHDDTPLVFFPITFSMIAEHDAQLMPVMASLTVDGKTSLDIDVSCSIVILASPLWSKIIMTGLLATANINHLASL
jgi:hypothetical protein